MVKNSKSTKKSKWLKISVASSIVAGVLLLIANSGYWANRYMFNSQNFANVASKSLTSDESKKAIAQGITEKIYAERPIAKRVLTEPTTNLLEGFLGSDRFQTALNLLIKRINIRLINPDPQPIVLELSTIKSALSFLQQNAPDRIDDTKFDAQKIPESITILEKDALPNLYGYSVALIWLSPLTLIVGLLLLGYPYLIYRAKYITLLGVHGITLIVTGLIALMISPLFKPFIVGKIGNQSAFTVVGGLYDAFIGTFNSQTVILIYAGLILLTAHLLLKYYPVLKKSTLFKRK